MSIQEYFACIRWEQEVGGVNSFHSAPQRVQIFHFIFLLSNSFYQTSSWSFLFCKTWWRLNGRENKYFSCCDDYQDSLTLPSTPSFVSIISQAVMRWFHGQTNWKNICSILRWRWFWYGRRILGGWRWGVLVRLMAHGSRRIYVYLSIKLKFDSHHGLGWCLIVFLDPSVLFVLKISLFYDVAMEFAPFFAHAQYLALLERLTWSFDMLLFCYFTFYRDEMGKFNFWRISWHINAWRFFV